MIATLAWGIGSSRLHEGPRRQENSVRVRRRAMSLLQLTTPRKMFSRLRQTSGHPRRRASKFQQDENDFEQWDSRLERVGTGPRTDKINQLHYIISRIFSLLFFSSPVTTSTSTLHDQTHRRSCIMLQLIRALVDVESSAPWVTSTFNFKVCICYFVLLRFGYAEFWMS